MTGMTADAPGPTNLQEFTVSELSSAVKRTIEGSFERVRVRGEISRPSFPASGHCYFRLKDENAVIDSVCWRGTVSRLAVKPEDGLEVIATGRMTTFAGKSSYQIVVEQIEVAGEGALLKLLEERKRKLAAEGLFAEERKRPLPRLPAVIGVITSPSGAVIRDILHRLRDRFPRHVLVWPVPVQGEKAAPEIAAAIEGFNALPAEGGVVPRPDLLIVARGGGSLEDLWAFNEEIVVRAAAASEIPLISAVGHETDTTLIDFASDRRAPTPTAAAEIAVPVRGELLEQVSNFGVRLLQAGRRSLTQRQELLEGLGRGLIHPGRLLEEKTQRLDDLAGRQLLAARNLLRRRLGEVSELGARLVHPRQRLSETRRQVGDLGARLGNLRPRVTREASRTLERLEPGRRLERALAQRLRESQQELAALSRLLDGYSYERTLERGFAVVWSGEKIVTRASQVASGEALDIEFAGEERVAAVAAGGGAARGAAAKPKAKPKPKKDGGPEQGSLL
ncbi:MAG: exodeoxyribonuclease VII large subunit [Limibacillus sp.]|jgi:exodeoxyribonuclease VII large subunit